MRKGSRQTPESIERIRLKKVGRKDSPETVERKRLAHLGEKNAFFGKHHTPETLELLRAPKSEIHKQHLREAKLGVIPENIEILKRSRNGAINSNQQIAKQKETMALPEVKDQMRLSHVRERNANWKNGRTALNKLIRESSRYYEWREAIYKRDNYTDVITGERGNGDLNVHHIVPYSEILDRNNITTYEEAMACDELWDISNGITMLEKNHRKLHLKSGSDE
jgi:5-methylcytosine-specific restriction endonuclease McrA